MSFQLLVKEGFVYKIEYWNKRKIQLSVKGGELKVLAPRGTKNEVIENLVEKHKRWIKNHLEYAKKKDLIEGELSDGEILKLRRRAREYISKRAEYYSNIMKLKYGRITITSAKTRFGSCSSKGNLSFSYRLMLYPDDLVDYVIVHELAHLLEMNHSERFYKIIESVLPDYKERIRRLKLKA